MALAPEVTRGDSALSTRILRFDWGERVFHWSHALAFFLLAGTGAVMFFPSLSTAVGNRNIVRTVHEFGGFAVPILAMVALALSPFLRRDLAEIDRLDQADREWWSGGWFEDLFPSRQEISGLPSPRVPSSGKFNAGQKMNAICSAAAMTLLFGTGLVMYFHTRFPLWLKQGAILVHDIVAIAVVLLVGGHVLLALRDRESLRGMITGKVSRKWGVLHHKAWVAEFSAREDTQNAVPGQAVTEDARESR